MIIINTKLTIGVFEYSIPQHFLRTWSPRIVLKKEQLMTVSVVIHFAIIIPIHSPITTSRHIQGKVHLDSVHLNMIFYTQFGQMDTVYLHIVHLHTRIFFCFFYFSVFYNRMQMNGVQTNSVQMSYVQVKVVSYTGYSV